MRKSRNCDIRSAAVAKGVYLYEIAEALGIADSSFSRKLRRELPEEEKKKILDVIDSLAQGTTKVSVDSKVLAKVCAGTDSILQSKRECIITGATEGLHKHHVFFGNPGRRISEENGFWCWLQWDWHNGAGYGVHFNRKLDLELKRMCQEAYEQNHSRDEFIRLIGKSYL